MRRVRESLGRRRSQERGHPRACRFFADGAASRP